MSLSAGKRLGPYYILEKIGTGGIGEVYRARDERFGRGVAIKVSEERFSDRYDREAKIVASLNHHNICSLFDLDEALHIAAKVAEWLQAAHDTVSETSTLRRMASVSRRLRPPTSRKIPGGASHVNFMLNTFDELERRVPMKK